MEITSGQLDVLLPGATEWQAYSGGSEFGVPAAAKFSVRVQQVTNYVCSYFS
jgi:uncharacterized protein YaiE (UPF0345 family)